MNRTHKNTFIQHQVVFESSIIPQLIVHNIIQR